MDMRLHQIVLITLDNFRPRETFLNKNNKRTIIVINV